MNSLLIGEANKTERLLYFAQPPFLLIDDGEIADAFAVAFPHAKQFDTAQHSFNPLRGMDYKRARDFVAALYTASPEGENTLTVRNGKRALTKLLLANTTRLDRLRGSDDAGEAEAIATVNDVLLSPVLNRVLCNPTNFSFKGAVIARIDRAQLGDFDAFVLATLLIGQAQGQVIVPDFGFYGRDFHMSLIRQNRLVCGVNFLEELSSKLQQAVLLIKDKTVYRTSKENAARLIYYTNHTEPSNITNLRNDEFLRSW